ncbi:hypothetical protein [Acidithiobacillus thiooxidans]|uniref:Uncharacterized protein n=1 Tax=Acidithiobacillus thiooxidans TaxID=930 RepID=A0A1C2I4P0_ACITH|nr:hypothetical protein [Acidithiobacillus thiooxidans]OCX70913.1 hypothetical protein A6M23_13230 [Acidithiobacillus thiooxidans]OCX84433.1 hypothetical protein A6P08_09080 [Acidithiobacillus thiooxidans]
MPPLLPRLLALPGQLMAAHPVIGAWSPLIVLTVWVLWSLVMIGGDFIQIITFRADISRLFGDLFRFLFFTLFMLTAFVGACIWSFSVLF